MSNNTLIIIPTYNEASNIITIIKKIRSLNINDDILVIDDNSPDNTANIVAEYADKNTILLNRNNKMGLGSAYCTGFKYAIDKNYKKVIQIDADLSHDPKDIIKLIDYSNSYDLVIGSRYIKGIRIINWPITRLILSYFANLYSRVIIGFPILDSTGGYKCISVDALKTINLDKIKSEGYSFQIEINFLLWMKNFDIKEIPIIFTDRKFGKSKLNSSIIGEAVLGVISMKFKSFFN